MAYTGTAGVTSTQLYANGVAIPDAIITDTVVAGTTKNSSFTTIIMANKGALGVSRII